MHSRSAANYHAHALTPATVRPLCEQRFSRSLFSLQSVVQPQRYHLRLLPSPEGLFGCCAWLAVIGQYFPPCMSPGIIWEQSGESLSWIKKMLHLAKELHVMINSDRHVGPRSTKPSRYLPCAEQGSLHIAWSSSMTLLGTYSISILRVLRSSAAA